MTKETISLVLSHYFDNFIVLDFEPYGNGLIHSTYRLELDGENQATTHIIQKLNKEVFDNFNEVEHNYKLVRSRLSRSSLRSSFPDYLKSTTGNYIQKIGKDYFRLAYFIDGTVLQRKPSPSQATHAAKSLANLHHVLSSEKPSKYRTILQGFHSGKERWNAFEMALRTTKLSMTDQVSAFIQDLGAHKSVLQSWDRDCEDLAQRIIHYDPKINNFIFAKDKNKIAAIIDFDTLMPGLILSDLGDMIRSWCNPSGEDFDHPEQVSIDTSIVRSILQGYSKIAASFATEKEMESLFIAGPALAYMQSVRFLTDYLNGNLYYSIDHNERNFVRAQVQFEIFKQLSAFVKDADLKTAT